MNHFSHTLAPLIFLTAFLLSLLTLLAPTTLFPTRVSLLHISGNYTASSPTGLARRSIESLANRNDLVTSHRMLKRATAKGTKASKASSAGTRELHIYYGPMGGCFQVGSGNVTCVQPSFTPIFVQIYNAVKLSSATTIVLPDQFPLAPSVLFLSTLLLSATFLASSLASIPFHVKKLAKLEKMRPLLTKFVVFGGGLAVLLSLVAAITWHIQLSNDVEALEKLSVGLVGELGSGFPQLWAEAALGLTGITFTIFSLFG